MPSQSKSFPDLVDLIPYRRAVAAGCRALRYREEELRDRFEPVGAEQVARDRAALENLRDTLDGLQDG